MGRSFRPSSIILRTFCLANGGMCGFFSANSFSSEENFGKSKYQCLVFLRTGVEPQVEQYGSIKSIGFSTISHS